MTPLQKLLGQFRLLWGEAPKGTHKHERGKEIEKLLTTAYNMGQQDLIDKIRNWIEPGEDPMENWKKVLNKLQALSSKKGRR